jgi:hypothetical protein
VIHQFSPATSDPTFRDAILPRAANEVLIAFNTSTGVLSPAGSVIGPNVFSLPGVMTVVGTIH